MNAIIEAYKKNFDTSLIDANLKLTVEQRFQQMLNVQILYNELRKAGSKLKNDRIR